MKMKKTNLSGILACILCVLMVISALPLVSVSALPEKKEDYNRYYFYQPEDWKNDYTDSIGIYWWEGTNPCDSWPGYEAYETETEGIFYYDVPQDVTTIIWNNFLDGGTDPEADIYTLAYETKNIWTEYYDPGESVNYPDGTESFDEMIYIIDPELTEVNEYTGKSTFKGEWYYYYGNGEYGFTKPGEPDIPEGTLPPLPTTGDALVTVDGQTSEVEVGSVITYTVNLTVPSEIEFFQGYISYDNRVLKLAEMTTEEFLPNVSNANIYNDVETGNLYFNTVDLLGYDFTNGEILAKLDFWVIGAGETSVNTTLEEVYGIDGEDFVTQSTIVHDGVGWTESIELCESNNTFVTTGGNMSKYSMDSMFTYKANITTPGMVEGLCGYISYDSSLLEYVESNASEDFPTTPKIIINSSENDFIFFNTVDKEGFDFTDSNLFAELDFKVIGTGTAKIELVIEEMWGVDLTDYVVFSQVVNDDVHWDEVLETYTENPLPEREPYKDGGKTVEKIEVEPIYIIENTNGYLKEVYDDNELLGEYFCYDIDNYYVDYTITWDDGTTLTDSNYYLDENSEYIEPNLDVPEQSYENPWNVGETYIVIVDFLNEYIEMPVTIVENPIESVEVEPVVVYKDVNSVTVTDIDEETGEEEVYDRYNLGYVEVKINLNDGTTETLSIKDDNYENFEFFVYKHQNYPFYLTNAQSDENRWSVGNTYSSYIEFMDEKVDFPVEIKESPIESVEMIKNPDKMIYDFREVDDFTGAVLRVSFTDGTYEDVSFDKIANELSVMGREEIYVERFDSDFYVDISNRYDAKDDEHKYLTFINHEIPYEIEVRERNATEVTISHDKFDLIATVKFDDGSKEEYKILNDGFGKVRALFTDKGTVSASVEYVDWENPDKGIYVEWPSRNGYITSNVLEESPWVKLLTEVRKLKSSITAQTTNFHPDKISYSEDSVIVTVECENGEIVVFEFDFALNLISRSDTEISETGDVNGDGKLNIRDATAIQKYLAKTLNLDEAALEIADFNQDGKVNVRDATAIQKTIAGIV